MTIQTYQAQARLYSRIGGMAYLWRDKIVMWSENYLTVGGLYQNCLHELGHFHHWYNDRTDMMKRTEYGKELYAEMFAEMILLDKYQIAYQTDYAQYSGYSRNQIYL